MLPFERYMVVEFACHHRREFRVTDGIPQVGEKLICLQCRKGTKVVRHYEEFRIRCSNCRYGRAFGLNRLQAEIAASKHHNRNPHHMVSLWLGAQKIRKWPPNEQQLFTKTLPRNAVDNIDVPPF
jgi:hypothetical protein